MEGKLGRAKLDSPGRCQAVTTNGQCFYKATNGTKYCLCHGGALVQKTEIFKYRLTQYQARLDELTSSTGIKSLRDEIAILRFLVQKRLDLCSDSSELSGHSTMLGQLILTIQSLTETCVKVEKSLETLIDGTDIISIAHNLLIATKTLVPDIEDIADDFLNLILRYQAKLSPRAASNYKIKKWETELQSFVCDEKVSSLRDEIGVLRILVEERLGACHDSMALVYESGPIISLIGKIEALVRSCHRLENTTGLLLDKEAAIMFAQELISLLGTHIKDGDTLERIATRFNNATTD